jgi:hypothetical protein
MNANDVLIDLLHDNVRRLQRIMATMSEDCLHWTPDPEVNSIAVTAWHMGRLFDVFLTRQIRGQDATHEVWFINGWAKRTGYDPRAIGPQSDVVEKMKSLTAIMQELKAMTICPL